MSNSFKYIVLCIIAILSINKFNNDVNDINNLKNYAIDNLNVNITDKKYRCINYYMNNYIEYKYIKKSCKKYEYDILNAKLERSYKTSKVIKGFFVNIIGLIGILYML
jgi:hypothetical protein